MSSVVRPAATARQTLPAPAASLNVDALLRDHERITRENARLLARINELEERLIDSTAAVAELARLRTEVLNLKRESRVESDRPFPLDFASFPMPDVPPQSSVASFAGVLPYGPGDTPTGGPRAATETSNAGIDFGTVSRLTPAELDSLPYGFICLDAQGRVVRYNDTESRLARLPKEAVLGKNFFQDVAPCTRVREFEGEFYDLVRDPLRVRVRSFDFVFRFRHSEQHVTIVITPARQRGLYNLALLRRSVTPR